MLNFRRGPWPQTTTTEFHGGRLGVMSDHAITFLACLDGFGKCCLHGCKVTSDLAIHGQWWGHVSAHVFSCTRIV